MKSFITTLFMLFITGTAFAAPDTCPCSNEITAAADAPTCSSLLDSSSIRLEMGDYSKTLRHHEGDSGYCLRVRLLSNLTFIDVATGTMDGLTCLLQTYTCTIDDLTDSELRACDSLMRSTKRDLAKLPDC